MISCCFDCKDVEIEKPKIHQSHFYCCGAVPQESKGNNINLFKKRHGMFWCSKDKYKLGVAVGEEAEESEDDFGASKICNPAIPFFGEIPDALYIGKTIQIHGTVNDTADRFAVNLVRGRGADSNLSFHFNARFDRRVIVRNDRRKGCWGEEEIASGQPFPFTVGRNFVMTIFVADGCFLVAVNNNHFCKFAFRSLVEDVRSLQIEGDLSVKFIFFHNSRSYPTVISCKLPRVVLPKPLENIHTLIQRKTAAIKPGTIVEIKGRLKFLPQNFFVNIQDGATSVPHVDIPFHLNLRFSVDGTRDQLIIFNSWANGNWGEEVKYDVNPLLPGMPFDIRIVYLVEGFQVTLNQSSVFAFSLRTAEPNLNELLPESLNLDTILISGDAIISRVRIKPTKLRSVAS